MRSANPPKRVSRNNIAYVRKNTRVRGWVQVGMRANGKAARVDLLRLGDVRLCALSAPVQTIRLTAQVPKTWSVSPCPRSDISIRAMETI